MVGAARELTGYLARNGQYVSTFVESQVGGDQRAAALARLDDHGRVREPGDDPVSRGEAPRGGLDSRWVFGDDPPARRDLGGERRMGAWIVAVDPAAEHGDRRSGLEGAAVRGRIDATREPRHDDDAGRGQVARECAGDLRSVRRAGPGTDDRDRGAIG